MLPGLIKKKDNKHYCLEIYKLDADTFTFRTAGCYIVDQFCLSKYTYYVQYAHDRDDILILLNNNKLSEALAELLFWTIKEGYVKVEEKK